MSLHVFSWDFFVPKKTKYGLRRTEGYWQPQRCTGLQDSRRSLHAPSFLAGKFETNNRVSNVGGGDRCSIATMELGRSVDWESVKSDSNTAKFPPVLNHPSWLIAQLLKLDYIAGMETCNFTFTYIYKEQYQHFNESWEFIITYRVSQKNVH